MPKFLVISYDDEQDQTFFDHVVAKDEDFAKIAVGLIRRDAIPCAALTVEELYEMANDLHETPNLVVKAELRQLNHSLNRSNL